MHACHVGDTWHDACMPCGFVRSIKMGSVEENGGKKKNEKKMREKEREKGRSDSFFLVIPTF